MNVPFLHTSTQRPGTSPQVTSFTRSSPAIVLQATTNPRCVWGEGGKRGRPGYEAIQGQGTHFVCGNILCINCSFLKQIEVDILTAAFEEWVRQVYAANELGAVIVNKQIIPMKIESGKHNFLFFFFATKLSFIQDFKLGVEATLTQSRVSHLCVACRSISEPGSRWNQAINVLFRSWSRDELWATKINRSAHFLRYWGGVATFLSFVKSNEQELQ